MIGRLWQIVVRALSAYGEAAANSNNPYRK